MKKLVLASTSPRRKEILELTGYDFDVVSPACDEKADSLDPAEYVSQLSYQKSMAGLSCLKEAGLSEDVYIIGSDTIVAADYGILGKPKDEEAAFSMLHSLAGKMHSVYTGVTIISSKSFYSETFYEKTDVYFYDVDDDEIWAYIKTKEPMDKAGAYGIQGKGSFLVRKIDGDYFNVVGLPVSHLVRVLRKFDKLDL